MLGIYALSRLIYLMLINIHICGKYSKCSTNLLYRFKIRQVDEKNQINDFKLPFDRESMKQKTGLMYIQFVFNIAPICLWRLLIFVISNIAVFPPFLLCQIFLWKHTMDVCVLMDNVCICQIFEFERIIDHDNDNTVIWYFVFTIYTMFELYLQYCLF